MDQNGWCTWQPPNDGNRKNYGKPSNLGYIFSDTPIHTLNLCHEKNTTYECLKHVGTKMVIPKGSLAFNGKAWQFPDWTQSYRPNIWCLVEVTLFQAGIDFHVHGGSQVSYPKMIVKDQSSNLWSRKIRKTFFGKSIQIRPRPGPLAQAFFIFFLEFFPSSMKWYPNKTPHHQPPDSRRDPQSPRVGDQDVLSGAHLPQIGRHAAIGIHLDEEDQDALQWVTQISVSSLNNTQQPEIYGTTLQLIELHLQLLSTWVFQNVLSFLGH